MEKKQQSLSEDVGSPLLAEEDFPGESADDSSDLELAEQIIGIQEVQLMKEHLFAAVPAIVTPIEDVPPGLPAVVTPLEDCNTQQLAAASIESVSRSVQSGHQPSATVSSPRSPMLQAMLMDLAPKNFDMDSLLGSEYIASTSQSPTKTSSCIASRSQFSTKRSSSQSPTRSSSEVASVLQFPFKRSSSQSPSKDSTYIVPSLLSPTKRSSSQSSFKVSTYITPNLQSPPKRLSSQSPSKVSTYIAQSSPSPTKRCSSQCPIPGSGNSASGSPSPTKQPKLYHRKSGKTEINTFLMLTQMLFKDMEHIHFHPIHEFCTCQDIIEDELFHIPNSTKVVKTVSEEGLEIRVDVRFYEFKNIFVQIEEDKISVEATRKTKETCYEYHHLYQVFSIPGRLQKKRLRATIKNGELIIKRCPDPERSSKETKGTAGGAKQKQAPTHPPSENVTHVPIKQDDEKCHHPRTVEFRPFTSSTKLKLKLNVRLFRMKDITVNLIEDKILIEAKREAHDEYEFHYLYRAFDMPPGLQESSLTAKIRDGELTVEGTIKPRVAESRKIPWLTSRAKPVFHNENFVCVPVVGHVGPCSPELSRFTVSICDSKFTAKMCVSMFERNKIHVRPKGKMICIEAERRDNSPFEYHSVFKCFELPTKIENFDTKSRIMNKFLIIEGTLKSDQNNML